MSETKSVIPLVHFSHANLIDSSVLRAHLDIVKIKKPAQSSESSRVLTLENGHHHHRSKRLKLVIQDEDMTYEGLEEDESPFMLGVVPKDSSNERISILDTSFFVLKPECYVESDEPEKIEDEHNTGGTYSEKLNSLTAAFGSSKKRRAMQTKLRNKIDSDALEVFCAFDVIFL